jgi:hypothetical protein
MERGKPKENILICSDNHIDNGWLTFFLDKLT